MENEIDAEKLRQTIIEFIDSSKVFLGNSTENIEDEISRIKKMSKEELIDYATNYGIDLNIFNKSNIYDINGTKYIPSEIDIERLRQSISDFLNESERIIHNDSKENLMAEIQRIQNMNDKELIGYAISYGMDLNVFMKSSIKK